MQTHSPRELVNTLSTKIEGTRAKRGLWLPGLLPGNTGAALQDAEIPGRLHDNATLRQSPILGHPPRRAPEGGAGMKLLKHRYQALSARLERFLSVLSWCSY